jgi:hypothetical protein
VLFVSYSRLDGGRLDSLTERLNTLDIDYWLDKAKLPVGEAFVARIGHALRQSQDFLLVDTQASRRSYWVSRELGTALCRRRERRLRWIIKFRMDPIEEGREITCDAVVDGAGGWKSIESLLNATPALQGTPDRKMTTLEPLLAGGDTGQPENWVGRQVELERLDVWWRSGSPVAWVEGQAGLGKSGLIRTWIAAFNELGYESGETCVTGYISGLDLERASTELEKWVQRHPKERLLLMIDGFDEARHPDLALAFTQRAIDASVRVLVSSRSAVPGQLASIGMTVTLADLAASSGEELLRNAGLEEQVSIKLLQRYGSSPLLLSMIARELSDGKATAEDLLNIDQMGSGLGQLLTRTVGALSPDARRLLETLAVDQPFHGPDDISQTLDSPAARKAREELATAGLVASSAEGKTRPIVLHEAIRSWVLENLPKGRVGRCNAKG